MAHPVVEGYSIYNSPAPETTYPIPRPAGTQTGDVILVCIAHNNGNAVFSPATNSVNPSEIIDQYSIAGITYCAAILIADDADPANYNFFSDRSDRISSITHRISGAKAGQELTPTGVIDVKSAVITSTGTTWTLGEIFPNINETLAIYHMTSDGGAHPITSTSLFTTTDSSQNGGACSSGAGWKNSPNPPAGTSDAFGNKGNNSRWYGQIICIAPEAGPTFIDLDLGHIDARPIIQPIGLTATANLGLGSIDAKPVIRAVSLVALANLGLGNIDALATVYPIDIEQPTPATELDLGHINAKPTFYPMSIGAAAELTLGAIDAKPIIQPVSFDALTDFALQSIDARATIYPIEIMQPGVDIELDLGHIDATPIIHPLELQATATLILQPIDATPTIRPINISVIAEINLEKIDATPTIYGLELMASAQFYLGKIDALATVYPINLTGPIEARGETQIMKIIGPNNLIKMLAKGDFIKILK